MFIQQCLLCLVSFFVFVKESSTKYFFCEGSQLWWDWFLDRARAYTCLWWPWSQVSHSKLMDFICWWTVSGLMVKEILRIGGAATRQLSSIREQSVWFEPSSPLNVLCIWEVTLPCAPVPVNQIHTNIKQTRRCTTVRKSEDQAIPLRWAWHQFACYQQQQHQCISIINSISSISAL